MNAHRAAVGLAVIALVLSVGSAAAGPDETPSVGARAIAVQLVLPGQPSVVLGDAEAPPGGTLTYGALGYPDGGSVVSIGPTNEEASVKSGAAAAGSAAADVARISLFGGEITADAVSVRARAVAGTSGVSVDFDGSSLTNLVVLGQPVQAAPGLQVQLADWGHVVVLQQTSEPGAEPGRGSETALDVSLHADHGGLRAGSRILVGYAGAWSTAAAAPPTTTSTTETKPAPPAQTTAPTSTAAAPTTTTTTSTRPTPAERAPVRPDAAKKARKQPPEPKNQKSKRGKPPAIVIPFPTLRPRLGTGAYVFPVYGPSGYSDTFGAARADVPYHHGDDIFASLGAPVLAVADGTVYSVGWEKLGGNRLWLRDRAGNEFYYAHLAAYSTLAVNGAQVHAGDVIGFVGNTGDAETTPSHLHFEVHPVELLFLGYDGAVDPTSYLDSWRHLQEVRLRPAVGGGPALAAVSHAPPPGAILLQSSDISTANGLEPGSLQRVLAGLPPTRDGAAERASAPRPGG